MTFSNNQNLTKNSRTLEFSNFPKISKSLIEIIEKKKRLFKIFQNYRNNTHDTQGIDFSAKNSLLWKVDDDARVTMKKKERTSPNIVSGVGHSALLGGQQGPLCPSFFLMCHFPLRSVPLSTNGHCDAHSRGSAWISPLEEERVRVKVSLKV